PAPAFAYAPSSPWPPHADGRTQAAATSRGHGQYVPAQAGERSPEGAPSYGYGPAAVRVPDGFGPIPGDLPTTARPHAAAADGRTASSRHGRA
ncbi:hypothetical protein, partial [Catellatospora methionotrophica]|uniref:hypothetical protein n=1 Tax=Catellatospora methionotrophica TaxID=121620 RepID=UPI00349472C6